MAMEMADGVDIDSPFPSLLLLLSLLFDRRAFKDENLLVKEVTVQTTNNHKVKLLVKNNDCSQTLNPFNLLGKMYDKNLDMA